MPSFEQHGNQNRNLKQLFQDESSFATALLFGAVKVFGQEMFSWSPAGLLQNLETELNIKLPQGCFDRLMAAITIATTDLFWGDLPTFIVLCNVLSGSPISNDFDPANVLETTWAITESKLIALDPNEEHQFSQDILDYIVAACGQEGIINPPTALANLTASSLPTIGSDFSQEPELYQATWYNQRTTVLDIELVVQRNLWKLYEQLKTLVDEPVKHKLTEMQNSISASIQALRKQEAELEAS